MYLYEYTSLAEKGRSHGKIEYDEKYNISLCKIQYTSMIRQFGAYKKFFLFPSTKCLEPTCSQECAWEYCDAKYNTPYCKIQYTYCKPAASEKKVPERQKNTMLPQRSMVFFLAIRASHLVPGHFFLKGKALLEEFSLLLQPYSSLKQHMQKTFMYSQMQL